MKKAILLLLIIIIVALSALNPHVWISPGNLIQGHQKLDNKCFACHTSFNGIDNSKCISCHKLSEIGKDDTNAILFHDRLNNASCTSCHKEHIGVLQNRQTLIFDHSLLGETDRNNCSSCHKVPITGTHQNFSNACNGCHTTTDWKSPKSFNHELILPAKKTDCILCHAAPVDNMHGDFGTNCLSCHSTNQWKPATFDHNKYFIFDGNHSSTCSNCHANNNFKAYSCTNCHEHSGSKLLNEHAEEGITDISNCVRCHRSGNEHDAEGHGEGYGGDHEGGDDD